MDDIVLVTNHGDTQTVNYGFTQYMLETGKPRIVPFDAVKSWLGDPATVNQVNDRARSAEYARVRTMWGFFHGMDAESTWENEKAPRFTVTTTDGDPILFVLHDPDGVKPNEGFQPTNPAVQMSSDMAAVLGKVKAQDQQIANLLAFVAQVTSGQIPVSALAGAVPTGPGTEPFDPANAVTPGAVAVVPSDEIPTAPAGTGATADTPKGAVIKGGRA